ncbi:MAG: FAD:protein FMN transferase [Anaerovoracaceae bacterium]
MKKTKKLISAFSLIALLIITQTGCGKVDPVEKTSYYLDTICKITIYNMENMTEENAKAVIDKGFKVCSQYENLLSKTKEGSDIYRINRANGQPTKVDSKTIEVIEAGIHYGEVSNGKFDITIGKATDLWDFHSETPKVPTEKALADAIAGVDYKQIKIKGNTVTMDNPNGEIDLGGIAKGYIADRVSEKLKKEGVTNAIIDLGGNIVAIGGKDESTDFNIGIERPYTDRSEIIGMVPLTDKTIVTSGVYERCFTVNGKTYHHILDVKTGYPVKSDVEAVTIVAQIGQSVDCDGLSTTCLMLGVEKGKKLIESLDGVEALFIDKDDNITYTKGMKFLPSN